MNDSAHTDRRTGPATPWPAPRSPITSSTPSRSTGSSRASTTAQDERLARLAARRGGPTTGRPGAPGTGARAGRNTTPNDRPANAGRPHPAGRARASALALSLTTTVGLAAYLHETSAVSASTVDGETAVISGSLTPATSETSATSATSATAPATAGTEAAATTEATQATQATDVTATTEATAATDAAATTAATDAAATTNGLADGTYTGDAASTKWGPVQVAITVSSGQITSVDVVQYPADDRKSVRINERALPTLISETLAVQSADVDTVSGATYTTDGYRASLQTAIDDARAAAVAG